MKLKYHLNVDENGEKYASLAKYYKEEGKELSLADIHLKLVELYNNAKGKEVLVEGTHYTVETLTKAQYDALDDKLKVNYADDYLDLVAVGNIADVMDSRSLETRYYMIKGLCTHQTTLLMQVVSLMLLTNYTAIIVNVLLKE